MWWLLPVHSGDGIHVLLLLALALGRADHVWQEVALVALPLLLPVAAGYGLTRERLVHSAIVYCCIAGATFTIVTYAG